MKYRAKKRNLTNCRIIHICCVMALAALFFVSQVSVKTADAQTANKPTRSLQQSGHLNSLNQTVNNKWVGALARMTEQFTVNLMQQAYIVGTFFDARQQLETQRLHQELHARAHKDYHPDVQMCTFGTGVKSLAHADFAARTNSSILNKVMLDRELNARGAASSQFGGSGGDVLARFDSFRRLYCHSQENGGQNIAICNADGSGRTGNDLDYTRTFDTKYSLDIDFTDNTITSDEADLLALGHLLFAHRTFDIINKDTLGSIKGRNSFVDQRSVTAMRSISRHSFAEITGMKTAGGNASAPFLRNILTQLGTSADQALLMLGDNPSYFAQMEILTQKIYQDPAFYTNLYTKPANVRRTGAALKAFELMQDRDRYESALRREMLISMMLETRLRDHQESVNRNVTAVIPSLLE